MSKAKREAVLAVYQVLNKLPKPGGGTQTASMRSMSLAVRWAEAIQGPALLCLDAVMNGDAAECRERTQDLHEALREAERLYDDN